MSNLGTAIVLKGATKDTQGIQGLEASNQARIQAWALQ
jgi:hypothetical protein